LILSKSIKKIKNLNFTKNIDIAKKFSLNLTLICSPVTSHLFYAKIFMDLNSNIFIEKPVANNVNQLQNFIQKIKKKKITILDGYNLRFDKPLIFFKNKILKNIQGKILCVKSEVGQYLPDWRKKNYSVSVSAKKKLDGGVINELSYDLDLIFMLFKSIKFVSAKNYKLSKLKINTEDTCHVVLKSKTRNNSFFIFVHMDFYRHDRTRKCTVIGSKATIE
jgi:predicted dehydrogenase